MTELWLAQQEFIEKRRCIRILSQQFSSYLCFSVSICG
jgi:hypothetical protein